MSVIGYAGFLSDMGHSVRKVSNVYWFDVHRHVYTSFPFHVCLDPNRIDLSAVLCFDGWVARYPSDIRYGRPSYRISCTNRNYSFENLTSKARNQTRRGLSRCAVEPVSFEFLSKKGMALNRETLQRQNRQVSSNFTEYWERYYCYASRAEGAEAWGAFVGGDLAAYLIAFRIDDCANILIVRSASEHLASYPNNALLFRYLTSTLREPNIREVSIGFESIQSDMTSLDHFKYGMGFRRVEVGQRVELASWLAFFARGPLLSGLQRFCEARTSLEFYRKGAGLLRWYREQPKIRP